MKKLTQELDKNKLDTNKISTPKTKSTRSSKASGTAKLKASSSKKATIKTESYKSTLKSAQAVSKKTSYQNEKASKFIEDISPYLTKKGEVRKNLSKAKKEQFNRLVREYKESGPTAKKVREWKKNSYEKGKSQGFYESKAGQRKFLNVMNSDAVKGIIKKGMDSDQIVTLYKTFDHLTAKNITDAIEHIKNKMEHDVPDEARTYLSQDDAYMAIEEYLAEKYGYKENDEDDEEIPFI